ncbi:MAG: OmpA family protein [Flavipsychrobacter sp.]
MRFKIAISIIFFLPLFALAQKKQDTISVYFDLAAPQLDAKQEQYLDSLAYHTILDINERYGIVGYADYVGDEASNIALSEKRANNVRSHLASLGIQDDKIEIVIGKGEISRTILNGNLGYRKDRRVDIIIGGFPSTPPTTPIAAKKKDTIITQPIKVVDKTVKPKPTITTAKKNETITLDNILFYPGSHIVRHESYPQMEELLMAMKSNPNLKIQIEGHICCHIDDQIKDGYDYDAKEYHLSRNRARFIYDYLLRNSISKKRMTYKGFGSTKPLHNPENTEEEKNENRRVEIRILDK